jgi:hypothetical protein
MRLDERNNLKNIDFSPWGGLEGFLRDTSNGAGGYSTMNLMKRISPFLGKAVTMTATAVSELPFEIISTTQTEEATGKDGKKSGKPKVIDSSADWQNTMGGMPDPKRFIYNLASSLCGGKAYVIPEFADASQQHLLRLRYIAPHTVLPLITTNGLQWFSRASDYGNAGIYYPITPAPGNPPPRKSLSREEIALCVKAFNNGWVPDDKLLEMTYAVQEKTEGYDGPIMYFWLPDSDIEIGPAKQYPLGKALVAAQTLSTLDNTIKTNSERNFIPPHLIGAKGMPSPTDREKTENWLNRYFIDPIVTKFKIVNAEAVTAVKIGAGLEDMKTVVSEIKGKLVEDIAAAFGIPSGIFTSDKSYATEMVVLLRAWYESGEFIQIYRTIEDTFNVQLLDRWGWKLKFRPETIDAFQEDENQRMGAFKIWVEARQRPSIGAQMLGFELPEGTEYADLDEDFDKPEVVLPIAPSRNPGLPPGQAEPKGAQEGEQAQPTAQKPPEKKPAALTPDMQKDVALWFETSKRFYRKGKALPVDWECKALPEEYAAPIRAKLATVQNELDIVKAFEIDTEGPQVDAAGFFEIAAALNRLADKQ